MIRAAFTRASGRRMVLLGLDRVNVDRLTDGQPIVVDGDPLGVPGVDVVICFGETLQALAGELRANGLEVPTIDAEPKA